MTGVNERMKESPENTPVLKEAWHIADYIDEDGKYKKMKWRTVERIGFYIRPFQTWFWPCKEDQEKLKQLAMNSAWIFGNKDYEPQIELNRDFKEIDDDSWVTLEEREPTKEEKERLKDGKWDEE